MVDFRTLIKFFLFLSSYTPLSFLLSVKLRGSPPWLLNKYPLPISNYYFSISLASILLMVIYMLIIVITIFTIKIHRNNKRNTIRVNKYQQRNELLSSYLLVYVFGFASLNFQSLSGFLAFFVFFWFLWRIQSQSEMLFINPLLGILGYRIYEITNENRTIIVISDAKISTIIEIPESQRGNTKPDHHKIDLVSLGENTYITPSTNE